MLHVYGRKDPTLSEPAFHIRDLPIGGPLVLAPMSGYNDRPFRTLCREFGASLVYTGLISVKAIVYGDEPLGNRRTREMLRFHPDEHPVVCQLYDDDPTRIAEAAREVSALPVDVIDLNMGCAKHKITRNGAGVALMEDPTKVRRIFTALSDAVDQPVTGKIRLGLDEADRRRKHYLTVSEAMIAGGASLVAVHGRIGAQDFQGEVDYAAIAEIKAHASVPVLASGDVQSAGDIPRILDATGCDGVMIGREAIGHPWIFRGRDRTDVPWSERKPVILRHLKATLDFHGPRHGVHRFRKHLKGYFRHSRVPHSRRVEIMQCQDGGRLLALLAETG
jgi:nifR3 family TIM-barrel protein